VTNPATETNTIGLLADAPLSWFLHRYLDNYIVTGQILPTYRDLQKRMPTPTQTATPHTTGPLAVRQMASKPALHHDFRRTSKSFAARPCNRPVAAKHMLFCLPGLRRLDNFIMTRQSLLFIGTLPSGQLYYNVPTPATLPPGLFIIT